MHFNCHRSHDSGNGNVLGCPGEFSLLCECCFVDFEIVEFHDRPKENLLSCCLEQSPACSTPLLVQLRGQCGQAGVVSILNHFSHCCFAGVVSIWCCVVAPFLMFLRRSWGSDLSWQASGASHGHSCTGALIQTVIRDAEPEALLIVAHDCRENISTLV